MTSRAIHSGHPGRCELDGDGTQEQVHVFDVAAHTTGAVHIPVSYEVPVRVA